MAISKYIKDGWNITGLKSAFLTNLSGITGVNSLLKQYLQILHKIVVVDIIYRSICREIVSSIIPDAEYFSRVEPWPTCRYESIWWIFFDY